MFSFEIDFWFFVHGLNLLQENTSLLVIYDYILPVKTIHLMHLILSLLILTETVNHRKLTASLGTDIVAESFVVQQSADNGSDD